VPQRPISLSAGVLSTEKIARQRNLGCSDAVFSQPGCSMVKARIDIRPANRRSTTTRTLHDREDHVLLVQDPAPAGIGDSPDCHGVRRGDQLTDVVVVHGPVPVLQRRFGAGRMLQACLAARGSPWLAPTFAEILPEG
jgi:hypothetical protein